MNTEQSFAGGVRDELVGHISRGLHCQKAELRAIYESSREGVFTSEPVAKKCKTLIKKIYGLDPDVTDTGRGMRVSLKSGRSRISQDLMKAEILEKTCCKRAYLRGWFLTSGTVTDPEGHYHLEIDADTEEEAENILRIMDAFELEGKMTIRKGSPVVYLKEGQKVVDFLNIVGAHVALMEYENARIVKEVRGRVNRQVNCETANIKKTISASARQIEDIRFLQETVGLDSLSEGLADIARMRLEYPEISLAELGERMEPSLSKSAVNHRLRRLVEMANSLRDDVGTVKV